ncbi:M6 family metalloprotease domain-containing protein [Porifericola rhodea]|uniref:M6 family metalloprotease domain-containing protein n=1 Tax=Porifericola rhodea TaxID=930972 RepID=UPI0026662B03|nr:M6 family metalloprotease domain-containing protein [Porifericola rhodea]WKN30369.1 M6 family metalloprotease domain-containing protein [Porifericola rhodea]
MRHFNRGWLVAFLLVLTFPSFSQDHPHAYPPAPYAVRVVQPNGQTLQIIARGNDHVHWAETLDGYTVIKNDEGYYEYAELRNNKLVGSGKIATDPANRSMQEMRGMIGIAKHLKPQEERSHVHNKQSFAPLSSSNAAIPAVPSKGKVKLLAICIDYPDLPHTKSVETFSRLLNSGINGNPSFKQYFQDNSYGQLDIEVEVVGWVKASKNYEYYGYANGNRRTRELVKEAIQAAEDTGVDFSQYDNDNDGDADAVMVIHSGPGAEEGGRNDYIWSHRWTIPFEFHDNTFIFDYAVFPEIRTSSWFDNTVGIGIFCHEFGHLLGLPDLYDTESYNGNSNGIGEWGVMGTGGWLGSEDYPASLSAWSKEKLGWVKPLDITESYGKFKLPAASKEDVIYKINTGRDKEYFLLENRQRDGFDRELRGTGLAVWHINTDKTDEYPSYNAVNGDVDLKGVDLEEADGNFDLDNMRNRADDGDLYPGSSKQTSFSVFTSPTTESYFDLNSSTETGISIEDIKENTDGSISFVHNRKFVNSGTTCDNTLIAFDGKNKANGSSAWFEFTMPRTGSLIVDTKNAGRPTMGEVFTACNNNTPLAQASSQNENGKHTAMRIKYLEKGQKVLIHWGEVSGQTNPYDFDIKIEDKVSSQDSLGLVAMYQQMSGAKWSKKSRWLSAPVSTWEGVTVENGRVTKLEFVEAGLEKSFPEEFYLLSELRSLTLINNKLSGNISNSLNQLSKLEEITIQEDELTGSFLENISQLNKLKKLVLKDVKLNAQLPTNFDKLSNLEQLEISNAGLSGGIPSSLNRLSKLNKLVLSKNSLSGSIPENLEGLWLLEHFELNDNQISGKLPAELINLPALKSLLLEKNKLSALPENFFSSNTLNEIDLSNNLIAGELPKTVNRSTNNSLKLELNNNLLTGTISSSLSKINFNQLDLSNNQLEGKLPALRASELVNIASNNINAMDKLVDTSASSSNMKLWCQSNKLTFRDLLKNKAFITASGNNAAQRFSPQKIISLNEEQTILEGATASIELGEEHQLNSNRFVWLQNGKNATNTQNAGLQINNFAQAHVGSYICKVTNTELPGLTLEIEGFELKLKSKQQQTINVPLIAEKTFGDDPFELSATASSNLPLSYSRVDGPISVEGNKVTITGAGEAKIKVSQEGNATYHAAQQEISFTIKRASQNIEKVVVADKVYGDENFKLEVKASSSLPVLLSVSEGNVSLNNDIVSLEGAGKVSIQASQEGNDNYLSAPATTITFNVAKASQTISFDEIADQVYGEEPLALNASASSDLPVSLRVVSGDAEINEGELIVKTAGDIVLEALQLGNSNYEKAEAIRRSFTVEKADQVVYFDKILNRDIEDFPYTLEAFSSVEGLEPVLKVIEGNATINEGKVLTVSNTGKVVIEASHPGTENYKAAEAVLQEFYVTSTAKAAQTIVLKSLPDTVSVLDEVELNWTVSSGLEPVINVSGPASINGNTLSFTAAGEVSIEMLQEGDTDYNAATPVLRSIYVVKAPQTIELAPIGDVKVGDEQISLQATSESGLPITYKLISGNVELNGNFVTILGEGEVKIEACQQGDALYAAAPVKQIIFTVYPQARLTQSLSVEAIEDRTYGDEAFDLNIDTTSDLPLSIEHSGPVSISNTTVAIKGAGSVTIKVYQKGNATYAPSDTVVLNFSIAKATQQIVFNTEKIREGVYLLQASSNADLAVSYEIVEGEAEFKGDTLFVLGSEDVKVQAIQNGNDNYLSAEPVSKIMAADKVTAINDDLDKSINVYPNPSDGAFNIELKGFDKSRTLSIHNAQGKLIYLLKSNIIESVDLSNHASGVYLLSVEEKGQVHHYRLIKR